MKELKRLIAAKCHYQLQATALLLQQKTSTIVRPGSSTELVTEAGFQSATMAPPGDLSSKSAKRRLVEKILED